jgi:hypothetical protein
VSCPFYGKHATKAFGLVDQGGNQCAILLSAYAPCYMEALQHKSADAGACELLAAADSRYAWERQEAARVTKVPDNSRR